MKCAHVRVFALLTLTLVGCSAHPYEAVRLHHGPIIAPDNFDALGCHADESSSINGPSVIRIPDWIPTEMRPQVVSNGETQYARYYLYFAHHAGSYIRMAWSPAITNRQWYLFNVGSNRENDLGHGKDVVPGRGVLDIDLGEPHRIDLGKHMAIAESLNSEGHTRRCHVASPDVHVDHEQKQIIMYFHGTTPSLNMVQATFVATSSDGLNFNQPQDGGQGGHGIKPVVIGGSYFRTFDFSNRLYALAKRGGAWRAPERDVWTWIGPGAQDQPLWERSGLAEDSPFQRRMQAHIDPARQSYVRHVAVSRRGDDLLDVWFSIKNDLTGEKIYQTSIMLGAASWRAWTLGKVDVTLEAEHEWEGSSVLDPYVFEDDGARYLFYSGAQRVIGVTRLSR